MLVLAPLIFALAAQAKDPDSSPAADEAWDVPEIVLEAPSREGQLSSSGPTSATEISRKQIESLPRGSQASLNDLLEVSTPSLVQGGYGRIFLRQSENGVQYRLDGIQLPDLPSNVFGEVFLPRYIQNIEVRSGALPAEFGEHPEGSIDITTRKGSGATQASAELNYGTYNTTSPEAMLQGRLNSSGSATYFFAGNYYRTDRGLNTPNPKSESDQTQGGTEVVHDSAFGNNEFGRVDWEINDRDQLTGFISNREDFWQVPNYPTSFKPTDAFFSPSFVDQFGNVGAYIYTPSTTNDSQSQANLFTELSWKHVIADDEYFQIGAYWQYFRLRFDNDPANDLASLTLVPGSNPSSYFEDRHTNTGDITADYRFPVGHAHHLQTGTQLKGAQTAGVISVIATNQGSPPATVSATDSSIVHDFIEGVYVQDQWDVSDTVTFNTGVRYEAAQVYYDPSDHPRYDQWEPRFEIIYLPEPRTKLHAFYGRLFNLPTFEDLHGLFEDLNAAGASAGQSGSFDIKPERDNYYELGVEHVFGRGFSGSFTGYYKQASDLLDDAQLLNTSLQQPFNWSNGYAYGIELALKGQLSDHWSDFFNYSYGLAKGQGISGGLFTFQPGEEPQPGVWQYLDHVQLHTASTGVTYASRQFWGSLTGLFGSGLRTGPSNSTNLPMHFSFDTTTGYEFLGHGAWWSHARLALDVTNWFDNRYAVFVANGYNGSYYAPGREFFFRLSKDFGAYF